MCSELSSFQTTHTLEVKQVPLIYVKTAYLPPKATSTHHLLLVLEVGLKHFVGTSDAGYVRLPEQGLQSLN
jgi:hypothetical protein